MTRSKGIKSSRITDHIRADLYRALKNPYIYLVFILAVLNRSVFVFTDVFKEGDRLNFKYIDDGIEILSAYGASLFIILVSAPFVLAFIEDKEGGLYNQLVSRGSVKKYAWSKIWSTYLATAALLFSLYALFLTFWLIMDQSDKDLSNLYNFHYIFPSMYFAERWPMATHYIVAFFMSLSVPMWTVFALILTPYTKSFYLSLSLTFVGTDFIGVGFFTELLGFHEFSVFGFQRITVLRLPIHPLLNMALAMCLRLAVIGCFGSIFERKLLKEWRRA